MEEDNQEIVKALTEGVVSGVGKQFPIYKDLLQPAVIEVGKGLAGAIKVALSPLSVTIWAYDRIGTWLQGELEHRLSSVNVEDIINPKMSIVGPAVEALRFMDEESELRKLFAQLIASSMDKKSTSFVHQSFVEVIKNLSTVDALLLKQLTVTKALYMVKVKHRNPKDNKAYNLVKVWKLPKPLQMTVGIQSSIINLQRLGLIEQQEDLRELDQLQFDSYLGTKSYQSFLKEIDAKGFIVNSIQKQMFTRTYFGQNFCKYCMG
jgi:hypothetical protein